MAGDDFQKELLAQVDALVTRKDATQPAQAEPEPELTPPKLLRLKSFLALCGMGPEKQGIIQYFAIREGHKFMTLAEWTAYAAVVLSRSA